MKKKIIILAAFVITFFTACTSTHMITFSNAELSDKEKDMIENNSNYSTASIVGGSAKLVKEERDKAIQEKIEARRNKLKAIDGLSISSYKDKNGKEQLIIDRNNNFDFSDDTIIIPDTFKENSSIDINYTQTQDTATPFALKMSPKLRGRLHGLELMYNQTKEGDLPCKLYFNIILFHKDKLRLQRYSSPLQNIYQKDGLSMIPDTKIVLPLLWNALPLYPSLESLKNTNRIFTMTTKHAGTFVPLFGDFQNARQNFSQMYFTRRGNLYGFDPMLGQNHNGMIFGSSGGGKSATMNNFVTQEIESGAMIRIIDEGKSYKNGVGQFPEEPLLYSLGIAYRSGTRFAISSLGEKLYVYGFGGKIAT